MTKKEAAKILELHNIWRCGHEDAEFQPPKKLTEALKIAVKELKKNEK